MALIVMTKAIYMCIVLIFTTAKKIRYFAA